MLAQVEYGCMDPLAAAIDPISTPAEFAARYGHWLHVDVALADTAMVLLECRWMPKCAEHADSFVFTPAKGMGIGFDLSAHHLRTAQHYQVSNFRD